MGQQQTEKKEAPRPNGKAKFVDFKGYKHVDEMSIPERTAHALDWARTHQPGRFVAYNVLVKAVYGLPSLPRMKNKDVETMRARLTRVKEILIQKYGCTTNVVPGIGVRATTDDEDVLKTALVVQSRRLSSARTSYLKTAELVDPANVPKTEENKPWLDWHRQSVKQVVGAINGDEFARKLLPPIEDDEA